MTEALSFLQPKVEFSKVEPINQRRIVAFVNHFLTESTKLLDGFMVKCEEKLMNTDQRLNILEANLCLLENQLSSIPKAGNNVPSIPEATAVPSYNKEEQEHEIRELASAGPERVDIEVEKAPESTGDMRLEAEVPTPINPEVVRFKKMLQVGVPLEAVKLKMKSEGYDSSMLNA